jgi:hypothetical protein
MKLTLEQFISKYGETEMHFHSYYKYSFSYTGKTPDGLTVNMSYGGSSDDVYRYEVGAGSNGKLSGMEISSAIVYNDKHELVDQLEYQGW